MKNVKKYVDKTLEVITSTLFLVMVAATTWQVITRYILNNPSSVTEEFVMFGLVWLSMLASAYVVGKNAHIAITLLKDKLKDDRKQILIDVVIQTSFLIFASVIMLYGGIKAVSVTMPQISPSLGIPMGLVYLSLPVAGILMIFYSIINIIELVNERKKISTAKSN